MHKYSESAILTLTYANANNHPNVLKCGWRPRTSTMVWFAPDDNMMSFLEEIDQLMHICLGELLALRQTLVGGFNPSEKY